MSTSFNTYISLVSSAEQLTNSERLATASARDFRCLSVIIVGTHLYSWMQLCWYRGPRGAWQRRHSLCDAQLLHQTSRVSLNLPMQCLFAHMPLTSTLQPATVSVKSCSQFQSNANCVYFNLTMLGEKKAGVGTVQTYIYIFSLFSSRSHRNGLYVTSLQQQKKKNIYLFV